MDNKKASEVFARYKAGNCTDEEKALLQNWVLYGKFEELKYTAPEILADIRQIDKGIAAGIRRKTKLWPRIAGMAAAVIGIAICIWLFRSDVILNLFQDPAPAVKNDIAPGGNRATLTVANGNTINLSGTKTGIVVGGDVKYNDGSLVQSGTTETLSATTPIGGTYTITLSDGTKVWLNADSKLEFPSKFGKTEQRIVKLSGEGYFEVARDHAHPFLVRTDKQEVTVLGTHFNINAYHDEGSVKTTLLEGSVSVSSFDGKQGDLYPADNVILKPSQQSVLSGPNRIAVTNVDANEAVAWKNGYFRFNQENIQSVMRKLSRWYGIDVAYESGLPQEKFTGRISRFKHISQVLKLMEAGKSVRFKVEGRRVTVIR